MSEDAMRKATIICREGTFAPTVMPFGLSNAPAVFAKLIDSILGDLKSNICLVDVDDVIVWSRTVEEHLSKLKILFDRLTGENLCLKPAKCHFMCSSLYIHGSLIDENGVSPDPLKLTGVSKLQRPTTPHQTRQVMGLFSYFRKHIKDFTAKAEALQKLVSVIILQKAILSNPVLAHFNPAYESILRTDASLQGLGAALFQLHPDGLERPVAFVSRTLSKAERNYTTMEMELTAIAWG